jgi:hypothetical protein
MPWYVFTAVWPECRSGDARTTNLPSNDAVRRYARHIIGELKQRPDYDDPGLKLIVRNGDGDVVDVIPF